MSISNIRVKVGRKYMGIYRCLTSDGSFHHKIFDQMGGVFVLCASLGHRADCRKDLNKGEQLFWSHNLTAEQEVVVKAIAATSSEEGLDVLTDDKAIIQIVETFAEAGMEQLIDRVLKRFIKEDDEGALFLHFTQEDLLEKELLSFIKCEAEQLPI